MVNVDYVGDGGSHSTQLIKGKPRVKMVRNISTFSRYGIIDGKDTSCGRYPLQLVISLVSGLEPGSVLIRDNDNPAALEVLKEARREVTGPVSPRAGSLAQLKETVGILLSLY